MSTPVELDELRAIPLREDRIRALSTYIEQIEAAARQRAGDARKLRDDDVRALINQFGPSEAARRAELSLSTIKMIRGRV